ncbi:MAG: cation:proton antiporter [Vallitaleaceae bacterium]|jgi:NhaP-type Na+/H+ or K+/H+ antiporter|nr:cation:proton antiporter [Vallitaleaceae bacterium]
MLVNFCLIAIGALLLNEMFERIKLPGLIGMILLGVFIGPHTFDLIDVHIMDVSKELRIFALIVILLRAGLGLKRETLNKVGKSAIKMSFIPGIMEGIAVSLAAVLFFEMSFIEAGILGFIIAAVSPAVVVPQMLRLKDQRFGENKQVPTLVLAGASVDDVFAITIFTAFLSLYIDKDVKIIGQLANIPISIVVGIVTGAIIGFALNKFFHTYHMRATKKVFVLLTICILYNHLETWVPINTLLGIMTIGFILLEKSPNLANELSK